MPLTALVITKNESAHIEACLRSVDWADERLVIDSGSTDDTAAIAARCGATVLTRAWDGYSNQKNFGTSRAKYDWILSIDADERVSPGLAAELLSAMASPGDRAGFRIPRVTFYLGRWIRCTDWYPDLQLRLYDRRRARWNGKLVHESVTADGPVGELRGDLEHFAYRDISHHLDTINKYTTLAADEMRARGRTTGFAELLLHPPAAFLRNYILKRGVTAGTTGLVVSILNSYHVFLKYAKLWAGSGRGGLGSGPARAR